MTSFLIKTRFTTLASVRANLDFSVFAWIILRGIKIRDSLDMKVRFWKPGNKFSLTLLSLSLSLSLSLVLSLSFSLSFYLSLSLLLSLSIFLSLSLFLFLSSSLSLSLSFSLSISLSLSFPLSLWCLYLSFSQSWVEEHNITGEFQAGFKFSYSCADHTFTLTVACVQKAFLNLT